MIKSSALFECGPLPPTSISHPPDVIHMISIRDRCPRPSPFFFFFAALPLPCIVLNANRRKNGGGLPPQIFSK